MGHQDAWNRMTRIRLPISALESKVFPPWIRGSVKVGAGVAAHVLAAAARSIPATKVRLIIVGPLHLTQSILNSSCHR